MMMREEAVEVLENGGWWDSLIPVTTIEGRIEDDKLQEAIDLAIASLRPVSREQVEKVWKGEWEMVSNGSGVCSECHRQDKIDPLAKFCRYCGAPMMDEAVEMVMERMDALHDTEN